MSVEVTPEQLSHSWKIQKSVVFALFLRELNARFGRFRLGILWAVLEPLAMIGILSAIRVTFGRADIAGLPFPVFFASGIIPFLFFSHTINLCLNAVESNQGLLNYQRVKPSDTVVARVLLEVLITLSVSLILFSGMWYLGFGFTWHSTLKTVLTVCLMIAFTGGLALAASVVGPFWQDSKKIIPVIIRPFFFISGILFAPESLPESFRDAALLNPLLQVTELLRMSMFSNYTSQYGSFSYLAVCSILTMLLGLALYRANHIRLVTSGNIR